MNGETGAFKCFIHDRAFETLILFYKHLKMVDHDHIGIAPCKTCDEPVKFKYFGKVDGGIHKPTCEDCDDN